MKRQTSPDLLHQHNYIGQNWGDQEAKLYKNTGYIYASFIFLVFLEVSRCAACLGFLVLSYFHRLVTYNSLPRHTSTMQDGCSELCGHVCAQCHKKAICATNHPGLNEYTVNVFQVITMCLFCRAKRCMIALFFLLSISTLISVHTHAYNCIMMNFDFW